jgi:EAL domain-containing protein (putative c-di-GMP-specific phosphodiesterase class I)
VNLSAAELQGEQVVDRLEHQVEAAGLDMYNLSIEITEDALLDRVANRTLARLAELRGRGAKLGLDDFGTGTSGLAQLLQLPLDEIKLDRTFTQRLGTDGRAERIVEGTMRALGCQLLQGWLIAPALPETALQDWLIARKPPAVVEPLRLSVAYGL